jgi:ubiquinone/menaquinone biosynthesis C-methylase UbiE
MNFSDKPFIHVKDFTVSQKTFSLHLDEDLQLLKTVPFPSLDELASYYESDDYISHTDSKRSLFEKVYHIVKKRAIFNKLKLVEKYASGKLLDIGAGTGDFLCEAKLRSWHILGIEPNPKAKEIAQVKGVHFCDITENIEDCSIDAITMWHVLEHVPDIEKQIKELNRILKPNGTIFIAVPNFKSYDANFYKEYWAAYDVPRHLWHFSKTAISNLFLQSNLELKEVKPMWFDSFYVSLLSEKYKTGKMNFLKGFYIGFVSNWKAMFSKEYSSHIYVIKKR